MSICKTYFTFGKNIFTMKAKFLLPKSFRIIGWMLLIPSILSLAWVILWNDGNLEAGLVASTFAAVSDQFLNKPEFLTFVTNDLTDEILLTAIVIGCLMIGFAKRPQEDEYIQKIRYESLAWAFYFNCVLMLLATWTVYGLYYFQVMMFGMISVPLFFIGRFQLMLYKLKFEGDDE